jgi:hypothetical protein
MLSRHSDSDYIVLSLFTILAQLYKQNSKQLSKFSVCFPNYLRDD